MPTTTPTLHQKGGQKTDSSSHANIYFSDWSVSTLKENSELYLSSLKYTNTDNNLLTQIKLFLWTWEIFTKATSLNSEGSVFEIYTSDTSAAVRWTIFLVQSFWWINTQISTIEWAVEVFQADNQKTRELILPLDWGITLEWWNKAYIYPDMPLQDSIHTITQPEYIIDSNDKTKEIIEYNLPEWKSLEAIRNGEPELVAVVIPEEENDWTDVGTTPEPISCDSTPSWNTKNFWNISNIEFWQTCPDPTEFTCNNWIWLDSNWNEKESIFSFTFCSAGEASICSSTTYEWYNIPTLPHDTSDTFYKQVSENNWTFKYSITATCENWTLFYNNEALFGLLSCNTKYENIDWICIENTLWTEWTLVDYKENITSETSLAWLWLESNFAFEFETNWISTNTTKKEYIIYNSEKILYTQDTNLKIANNNEIIKYSENWENLNIIKIKFEWDIWNIVWINMSDEWVDWEPSLLEWNYIKLNNVKNVKIYKK